MPTQREIIEVERYDVSSLCVAAAISYQGRQTYMEDRFSVLTNINGSEISLYAIFDGHAGEFAADYAKDIIMPNIAQKLSDVLDLLKLKTEKSAKDKELNKRNKTENTEDAIEEDLIQGNPLNVYITSENLINYNKLLYDEIISNDAALTQRMANAALFGGTTANIVLVDLTCHNKTQSGVVVCANVGDSRAILCDSKGIAYNLSKDHKPDNPEELSRIQSNGGYVSNKSGCWRVDGSLACSRSLGDYPLKQRKVLIADPDIRFYDIKDHKNLPKFIIIGSDGLFDVFGNQEICDYAKTKLKENHYGARSLMKKAYARKSSDNISVIVIKFIKPKAKKAPKPSYDLTSNTYEWLK